MSETLREALRRAAESAPAPRMGEQLWRRGRRRRRVRRAVTGLAGLLLVVSLAAMPGLLAGGAGLQPADGRTPATLGRPYAWQLTYGQDANGPVVAAFIDPATIYLEATGVLVGRDGSYRLFPMNPGEDLGFVSPDGRYLARWGEIVDLVTGRAMPTVDRARPLAWAPDSRRLLLVVDRDDGFIEYGPNGESDPSHPDDVGFYDLDSGTTTILLNTDADTPAGAFSPDGRRIAVTVGKVGEAQTLRVIDVAGASGISLELTDRQRLAGEAAWTPDGRSVVLVAGNGCPWSDCEAWPGSLQGWRMQRVDVATGEVADEAATARPGFPGGLVGWRDGEPVFVDQGVSPEEPEELVVAAADGAERVLLVLAHGSGLLNVPRDEVEHGALGSQAANPLAAQPWVVLCLLACLAPPVLLLLVLRRRRRAVRALRGSGVGQGAGADDLRAEGGDAVA
ncbi:PD40 domain-containing protein [Catellatospora sichuanensis]|uniref:PD40 domain-containing protein n=1 Tax=Catellatospora sichuanensis TaxID=1969805 RepID=UPI00118315E6|nr:PD40 domain-containing protein [Catellatospora sichuanensis]